MYHCECKVIDDAMDIVDITHEKLMDSHVSNYLSYYFSTIFSFVYVN